MSGSKPDQCRTSLDSFEDATACLRGMLDEIADYMACKVKEEITAESIVYVVSRKD